MCIKREHVDEFHAHLNSINPHIKFTIEIESEGSIAFLDTRTTRSFSVKVAHKPIHTISNILKKPKDKIWKEAARGIVYKIRCKDCDSVYVGETSHALKTRVKEHAKAIATLDEKPFLAKHHTLHSHEIDLENVKIVDRSPT